MNLPKSGTPLLAAGAGLLVAILLWGAGATARPPQAEGAAAVHVADLPAEVGTTLALIRRGGPYPYRRDGSVFANREGRLPAAPRGTYREYTVPTPGHRDRGARRIVAIGTRLFWYSEDHYRSFRRIIE